MKRISFLVSLAALAFSFASCEKEASRPDYNYSFKVNGVEKKFSASGDARILYFNDPGTGGRLAMLTMATGSDITKNSIVISLRTVENPIIGINYQMQEEIVRLGQTWPQLSMVYFDENGKAFGATLLWSRNPGAADNCNLTLVEFTDDGSTGTFEGVLFDMDDDGPLGDREALLVTEGKFLLANYVEN